MENKVTEQRARTGDTVTVACKIPMGLVLHIDDMVEETEPTPTGFRKITIARKRDETYTVVGPSIDLARLQQDRGLHKIVIHGCGLTPDIPLEFWEEWLEQHRDHPLVKNGQIFAQSTEAKARAHAKEMKDVRSGLEPIDPTNPQAHMPPRSMLRIEPGTRSE